MSQTPPVAIDHPPVTIFLAGSPYAIEQLTIGQIEDLSVCVLLPDTGDVQEDLRRSYQRTFGVIAAALALDHPQLTVDTLRKMKITRDELSAAYGTVLNHSGLRPAEKTAPGEADAGTESTGQPSTAVSAAA